MFGVRVLLAPSAYYPHVGGIEELTRQLALALAVKGHETSILTNRWPGGVAESELLDGVQVTRLAFPLPAAHAISAIRFLATAPSAVRAVASFIRGSQPDVVHVIGAGPQSVYLGMLARRLGAPLVFTTGGELTFDAHGAFERSATLRAGLRRTVHQARIITACSDFTLKNLEKFVQPRSPSFVVPNGVDLEEFASRSDQEIGFEPFILGVGRLVPQKGFDVLLDAFATSDLPEMNLVIAGEGFEREALMQRASRLGIVGRVHLVGAVGRGKLVALMHSATAFALPSRGEPFGIALLEAMAAGVPSVATDAGGVPELARDGENALVVAPDNPGALSSALARLVNDGELRTRLSARGRETARGLTWSRIAERYEAAYEDARTGAAR